MVSPSNYAEWQLLNNGRFEMPQFESVGQLAEYIYESAAVVANDSGNGHLASFLGVPIITIYKKRNPKFHWRPDWGSPSSVVCPWMVIKFGEYRIWRFFVSVNMVLRALARVINRT